MASEGKSWYQRKNESPRQFELFEYYLSLEPLKRTYQSVSKHFSLSREYVEQIARKFFWVERSRSRNNFFAELADDAAAKAVREVEFDWIRWETANLDRVRVITENLLSRCEEMLAAPIVEQTTQDAKITDSQGNEFYQKITTVKPVRFTASDVPKHIEAVVILTKYLSEQNKPALMFLPPPAKAVESMTIQEREAYIAEIRTRQQAIADGKPIEFDDENEQ